MDETYSKRAPEDAGEYVDEAEEWLRMTPAERLLATTPLWALYLAMGGSLDPEPDHFEHRPGFVLGLERARFGSRDLEFVSIFAGANTVLSGRPLPAEGR